MTGYSTIGDSSRRKSSADFPTLDHGTNLGEPPAEPFERGRPNGLLGCTPQAGNLLLETLDHGLELGQGAANRLVAGTVSDEGNEIGLSPRRRPKFALLMAKSVENLRKEHAGFLLDPPQNVAQRTRNEHPFADGAEDEVLGKSPGNETLLSQARRVAARQP